MPAKNIVKTYIENGYYHIYNRGVDKRQIFLDEQDCKVFLYYLKIYLSSPDKLKESEYISPRILFKIINLNLSKELHLLSFALMPNHFHLHIKQFTKDGMEKLTRRVLTAYVQYFNKKYKRTGKLYENTYKATSIENDNQNLYLTSYIHRNPMRLQNTTIPFLNFSSYPYYLGKKNADWIKPDEILSYFRSARNVSLNDILSYQNFVESFREKPEEIINAIVIESLADY